MSAKKKWATAALSLILAAVAAFCAFFAYPALTRSDAAEPRAYRGVLRLWHIDGFEGGRGSRAAFLGSAASVFESENEGLIVMITVHTAESAAYALSEGSIPDMISYGGGCDFVADCARPLEKYDFAAASAGHDTLGVPWCRGGYFLFSGEGDFSDVSDENTVISEGRENLPEAAAALNGLQGEFDVLSVTQAYTALIGGKYKYMLGTQRDVWRLRTRGFAFTARPLSAFCDLWQYISVCARDTERYNACLDFVALLLSDDIQGRLGEIGMISPYASVYSDDETMHAAETASAGAAVYAFADAAARGAMREAALLALKGDENGAKKLKNYLL